MKLVLSTTVEGISTRQDGSVAVKLSTQELDPSQASSLFSFRNKFCKVLLSDSGITAPEEVLIDEVKIQDGRKIKTQSQRLRAVLYRLWEQLNTGQEFDQFYKSETDKVIEHFKSKLS